MIYERTHKPGIDEVNRHLQMTNSALIALLQNTACFHADSIHYGVFDIPRTNLTWFIIDWKAEILKRPHYGEELTVRTWARNVQGHFCYRDFEVYAKEELCVRATSKWALFDARNMTYAEMPEEMLERFGHDEREPVFQEKELEHLSILEDYDEKTEIRIRKTDLDFNRHVNNVKYLDYLIDYGKGKDYDRFRIAYRKQIREEEKVYLCHSLIGNVHHYAIVDEENNIKTIIKAEDNE